MTASTDQTHLDLAALVVAADARRTQHADDVDFERFRLTPQPGIEVLVDRFDGEGGSTTCLFVRSTVQSPPKLQLCVDGEFVLRSCAAGGWILRAREPAAASFWLPCPAAARTLEAHGRITAESVCWPSAVRAGATAFTATFERPAGATLDFVVWAFPAGAREMLENLLQLDSLERAPTYTWSARSNCASPADIYKYVVHGHIYQSSFAWPRKWRFCCELDGYELFLRLRALELASGKLLYRLLRQQLVLSVLARQAPDGAWYHGEWTDGFECHHRFLAGALLLLAAACQEWPRPAIADSLRRGADFLASRTDSTTLGPWFLHDSLEQSPAQMDEMERMFAQAVPGQTGRGAWYPTKFLGKSPTNKMILNTHVDTTVTLSRVAEVSGDDRHETLITEATAATRAALMLRPAKALFDFVYAAVDLTLLPHEDVQKLSRPRRLARRLASRFVLPNLCRLKWRYPRFVMPRGFIERHLSPIHFDVKYHAVNVLDLVRLQRRAPDALLLDTIEHGVHFVTSNDYAVLRWWAEAPPRRFSVVVFTEALVHLCTLDDRLDWREHLARALRMAAAIGLGLPPSAWGTNPEILLPAMQVPCPVPTDPRLIVVNLCRATAKELLVINPSDVPLPVAWTRAPQFEIAWRIAGTEFSRSGGGTDFTLPPGSWAVASQAG